MYSEFRIPLLRRIPGLGDCRSAYDFITNLILRHMGLQKWDLWFEAGDMALGFFFSESNVDPRNLNLDKYPT